MGPLYRVVLDQAEAVRAARIVNRTSRRAARFAKFMAQADRIRWRRQGHRVTWR